MWGEGNPLCVTAPCLIQRNVLPCLPLRRVMTLAISEGCGDGLTAGASPSAVVEKTD